MKSSTRAFLGALVMVAATGLSGCDEDEQDRILRYEPGTYLGEKDTPLTDQRVDELRQRAANQGRL